MNKTIVALSTPPLLSALAVIRLSGSESFTILSHIFTKDLSKASGHTLHYGDLIDPLINQLIDRVLVSKFIGPKSFTGEDMIEISCHGNMMIVNKIIGLCLTYGAVLAGKGEFTKKSYMNRKVDLVQAESINDLIHSSNEEAANLALLGVEGKVSKLIRDLSLKLGDLVANIEVNIDYPEYYDIEEITLTVILPVLETMIHEVKFIVDQSKIGKIIHSGITTAIVGKPNVGKSSLLNALLGQQKAIVTNIPGTTRDIVEGSIQVKGITLHLLDTAGIHASNDMVESIGIEKSIQAYEHAELILVVLDASSPLEEEDFALLEATKNLNRIIVLNKSEFLVYHPNFPDGIRVSALLNEIEALQEAILNHVGFEPKEFLNVPMLSNTRQIGLLNACYVSLLSALQSTKTFTPIDLIVIDLKNALDSLHKLLGEEIIRELDEEIFSRFCVGK